MIQLDRKSVGRLLLDVEGTTTPIDFVQGTLFPFARRSLRDFLSTRVEDPEVRSDLDRLRREQEEDRRRGSAPPEAVADYLEWLMDRDRKSTVLKSLQGKIWEAGYRSGELRGRVFEDVAPSLERWTRGGLAIRIFSSGSVLAQRLLFGYSTAGDLTGFISGYFDTTTGSKQEAASYGRIARAWGCAPSRLLFVSDSIEELAAAAAAGCRVALSLREGNVPPAAGYEEYEVVRSLEEIEVR